jgi:hypothetical protein
MRGVCSAIGREVLGARIHGLRGLFIPLERSPQGTQSVEVSASIVQALMVAKSPYLMMIRAKRSDSWRRGRLRAWTVQIIISVA